MEQSDFTSKMDVLDFTELAKSHGVTDEETIKELLKKYCTQGDFNIVQGLKELERERIKKTSPTISRPEITVIEPTRLCAPPTEPNTEHRKHPKKEEERVAKSFNPFAPMPDDEEEEEAEEEEEEGKVQDNAQIATDLPHNPKPGPREPTNKKDGKEKEKDKGKEPDSDSEDDGMVMMLSDDDDDDDGDEGEGEGQGEGEEGDEEDEGEGDEEEEYVEADDDLVMDIREVKGVRIAKQTLRIVKDLRDEAQKLWDAGKKEDAEELFEQADFYEKNYEAGYSLREIEGDDIVDIEEDEEDEEDEEREYVPKDKEKKTKEHKVKAESKDDSESQAEEEDNEEGEEGDDEEDEEDDSTGDDDSYEGLSDDDSDEDDEDDDDGDDDNDPDDSLVDKAIIAKSVFRKQEVNGSEVMCRRSGRLYSKRKQAHGSRRRGDQTLLMKEVPLDLGAVDRNASRAYKKRVRKLRDLKSKGVVIEDEADYLNAAPTDEEEEEEEETKKGKRKRKSAKSSKLKVNLDEIKDAMEGYIEAASSEDEERKRLYDNEDNEAELYNEEEEEDNDGAEVGEEAREEKLSAKERTEALLIAKRLAEIKAKAEKEKIEEEKERKRIEEEYKRTESVSSMATSSHDPRYVSPFLK